MGTLPMFPSAGLTVSRPWAAVLYGLRPAAGSTGVLGRALWSSRTGSALHLMEADPLTSSCDELTSPLSSRDPARQLTARSADRRARTPLLAP